MATVGIAPATADGWKPAPFTRLVTGHDASAKAENPKETYHAMSGEAPWQRITPNAQFSLIYTTSHGKPEMSHDKDVEDHNKLLDSGKLSLVHTGEEGAGSVCRAVEFAPRDPNDMEPYMHRTQSLDYGIVVKGQVELILPNNPPRLMSVGDVAVQRGTNHAWRNASTTEPARVVFVLLASERLKFDDVELGEELPSHAGRTKEVLQAKRV